MIKYDNKFVTFNEINLSPIRAATLIHCGLDCPWYVAVNKELDEFRCVLFHEFIERQERCAYCFAAETTMLMREGGDAA